MRQVIGSVPDLYALAKGGGYIPSREDYEHVEDGCEVEIETGRILLSGADVTMQEEAALSAYLESVGITVTGRNRVICGLRGWYCMNRTWTRG